MSKLSLSGVFVGAVTAVVLACVTVTVPRLAVAQPPAQEVTEPAPPAGQAYTGSKRCSSCHFKQYMSWKKTKHATALTNMPVKYQGDAECLKCHVTAYGVSGGYAGGSAPELLQNLLGVTCEACHGPGSKHEEVAKQFANKKTLAPEEEKAARDSIWKVIPVNICSRCHISQGHQEHPKYDKQ